MIHTQEIGCPNCKCTDIVKNGHRPNGDQRWKCNKCKKSFRLWTKSHQKKIGKTIAMYNV